MSIISFLKNVSFSMSNDDGIDDIISSLQDSLSDIKHAIANITTEKKRLEIQSKKLENQIKSNKQKAKKSIRNGNKENAKFHIRRKLKKEKQYNKLRSEIRKMSDSQDRLVEKKENIESQLNEVRTKRSYVQAKEIENEIMDNVSSLNIHKSDTTIRENMKTSKEEVERELDKMNN